MHATVTFFAEDLCRAFVGGALCFGLARLVYWIVLVVWLAVNFLQLSTMWPEAAFDGLTSGSDGSSSSRFVGVVEAILRDAKAVTQS